MPNATKYTAVELRSAGTTKPSGNREPVDYVTIRLKPEKEDVFQISNDVPLSKTLFADRMPDTFEQVIRKAVNFKTVKVEDDELFSKIHMYGRAVTIDVEPFYMYNADGKPMEYPDDSPDKGRTRIANRRTVLQMLKKDGTPEESLDQLRDQINRLNEVNKQLVDFDDAAIEDYEDSRAKSIIEAHKPKEEGEEG